MIIDRVIVSSDEDRLFLDFWPLIAASWQKFGYQPTLALVSNNRTQLQLNSNFGDVHVFNRADDISDGFLAKTLRIYLPTLYPDDMCLISDIDMLPLSREYFSESIVSFKNNQCILYSADAYPIKQNNFGRFPMCYIAAKGSVFSEILGDLNFSEFLTLMKDWYKIDPTSDEVHYSKLITSWEKYKSHVVKLSRGGWRPYANGRLDRGDWQINYQKLTRGEYIDAHLPRPAHKKIRFLVPLISYLELPPDIIPGYNISRWIVALIFSNRFIFKIERTIFKLKRRIISLFRTFFANI